MENDPRPGRETVFSTVEVRPKKNLTVYSLTNPNFRSLGIFDAAFRVRIARSLTNADPQPKNSNKGAKKTWHQTNYQPMEAYSSASCKR